MKEAILFLAPDLRVGGRRLSFHALEDIFTTVKEHVIKSIFDNILHIYPKNNIRGNFLLEKRKNHSF